MDKVYCSKCNRCLTDDKGTTVIGLSISLFGKDLDKDSAIREQLGKYNTNSNDITFNFCYECWLDSLMGRNI